MLKSCKQQPCLKNTKLPCWERVKPSSRTSKSKYLTFQTDGLIDLWSNCLMCPSRTSCREALAFSEDSSHLSFCCWPYLLKVLFLHLSFTPSGPGLATHINCFHGTSSLAFISDTIMWFYGHLSNNKSNYVSLRFSPWVHHFFLTETVFLLYHFASFCSLGEESDFNLGVCTRVGILCSIEWAYT